MNFIKANNFRFVRLAYVGLALLGAILFDQFVIQSHGWGLGVFLMIIFLAGGFAVLVKYTGHLKNRWALLLLAPIFILSFDLMLYNNFLVVYFLPLAIFILVIFFAVVLTVRNENKFVFYLKNIPAVKGIFVAIKNLAVVFRDLFSWGDKEKHNEKYKQIAIGLAVAVPILLLFTLLFAGADKVFSNGLEKIFSFNYNINFDIVAQIIRIIIITFFASAFFYTIISHENTLKDGVKIYKKISFTVASIVLSLVNILFAIFVFIQIKYLFGTHDFVIESGFTFAEYARSGFFQLVWVIALAGLMLILFYRGTVFHGSNLFLKLLKIFLILQVGIIAMSALKRMNIYQAEFGFTVLRLYVEWFIYFCLVILGLVAVSVGIGWEFRKFFYTSLVLGLGALCLVSSLNVDRMIARENVNRYLVSGKELDMGYLLFHLSADAVPEIKRAFANGYLYNGAPYNDLNINANNFAEMYLKNIFGRFNRVNSGEVYTSFSQINESWKEFNLGIHNLKNL